MEIGQNFDYVIFEWSLTGTLSLRRNEFTLSIDPQHSTTKAVSFDFFLGIAHKSPNSAQSAKYHKMKILSPAEQEQRVEHEENLVIKQLKKLIPVSLVAEPVENKSLHPERQEKIVKALTAMEQSYPSLSQSHKGVLATNLKVSSESYVKCKSYNLTRFSHVAGGLP